MSPRFSGTNAASLSESAEYGIAATELIEEVYDQNASASALQKETPRWNMVMVTRVSLTLMWIC